MKIELLLSDEDRQRYRAPEVLILDTDRVHDTPARLLIRWEAEAGGYSIERALTELVASNTPPAAAVVMAVWLARKQMGVDGGGVDEDTGRPEAYGALLDLRPHRVGIRAHAAEPVGDDADPPGSSPASSSES